MPAVCYFSASPAWLPLDALPGRQAYGKKQPRRLRQRSSHISSLTIAFCPFPLLKSCSCSTAVVCVAPRPLRKACIHLLLSQLFVSLTGLRSALRLPGAHASTSSKHKSSRPLAFHLKISVRRSIRCQRREFRLLALLNGVILYKMTRHHVPGPPEEKSQPHQEQTDLRWMLRRVQLSSVLMSQKRRLAQRPTSQVRPHLRKPHLRFTPRTRTLS
jgi:hypothetical protein